MNQELAQVLIHDDEAEKYVIGSLLVDSSSYTIVCQYLVDDCFYNAIYKEIWKVIDSLVKAATPVDIISVSAELTKRESKITTIDIMEITMNIASSSHVEYHALRLLELSRRRRLWVVGQEMLQAGLSEEAELADVHQKAIEGINGIFEHADGVSTLKDAMDSLNEIINMNLQHGGVTTGTRTGFARFDEKGGLQKSDLIIVAGETSQGKTSLALTMTGNAICNGAKVAFYSMEMTKEQLAARLLASKTKISANSILYSGALTRTEIEMIDTARGALPTENLYFDDRSTSNLDSILMSIRTLKMQSQIDGAVVDYLQILNVNSKNYSREQCMGDAARRLKNIAKELGIWVIALSQLSRNSTSPEPTLNRLRDSGQIAEAADVVMLVYRPEYYNLSYPAPYEDRELYPTEGTAMVDVAKGRNIGTFKFFLGFDKETASFFKSDIIDSDNDIPIESYEEADAPF